MKSVMKSAKKTDELTPVDRFIAGSSAGAISQTVIYPMEVSNPALSLSLQLLLLSECISTL